MLDWYGKALDLPDFFLSKSSNPKSIGGGALQGSASDAIYACMMAARNRAIKQLKGKKDALDSTFLPKLTCYASSQAHSSVEKAAMMALVILRVVEPDENENLRGPALKTAIEKDVKDGFTPFFVVGTLGTTSQAAFDNIDEMGAICKKYKSIWFHADGAYGGAGFLLPEKRHLKKGMEYVDSFNTNPNKLLLTACDCSCMWVKDMVAFTSAFAVDAEYLKNDYEKSVVDLRHIGVPLSRRFRSLKLFFMFRMYGLKELQGFVKRVVKTGEHFKKLVEKDKRFELLNDVHLGLVCFRLW